MSETRKAAGQMSFVGGLLPSTAAASNPAAYKWSIDMRSGEAAVRKAEGFPAPTYAWPVRGGL
jgi:hypothetical protein